MTSAILALLLVSQEPVQIERDPYGVPILKAATWERAFFLSGYANAQDRMGQMENSRRAARGRLAEVFGVNFANSDREVLKFGYRDEELQAQLDALPLKIKSAFTEYASGINAWIAEAKSKNALPEVYANYGFEPEPWTTLDSAAISVKFFQTFGRGGAGEIRNWALAQYLGGREGLKNRIPDVVDDIAWFNDPQATTTVPKDDDPLGKNPPKFVLPSRADTSNHLAGLPKVGMFELLPAIRIASMQETKLVAERVGSPWKSGSYAIVVGGDRSASGYPMLLGAPQMGWGTPSIVTEMAFQAPGLRVTGMGVPGVPGVMIGATPDLAWTMTTGVADTEDVVYVSKDGEGYTQNGAKQSFETFSRTLKIKGQPDETIVQKRTLDGPVVLESTGAKVAFARRSSFYKREIQSFEALYGMYDAKSAADVSKNIDRATLNFNAFFATRGGDTGYFYAGMIPIRTSGFDPRFPIPADAKWQGFIPRGQMPHLVNPKGGLLANWNNKPATWWPNGDTPVWGRIFRDRVLRDQLTKLKLNGEDLERAAWAIARTDDSWWAFRKVLETLPDTPGARKLKGWDGWALDGSEGAWLYKQFINELRTEIFAGSIGSLVSPDNFRQALQPSLILNALERKTKVDWLAGRKPADVVAAAFQRVAESKAASKVYRPGTMLFGKDIRVPYSDRGTYIQVVEFAPSMRGRNVLAPGQAETGVHSMNQIDLARTWTFKEMVTP